MFSEYIPIIMHVVIYCSSFKNTVNGRKEKRVFSKEVVLQFFLEVVKLSSELSVDTIFFYSTKKENIFCSNLLYISNLININKTFD